LILIEEVGAGR